MSGPIVSGWHNITGGTPSIEVNGILYKDIVDILENLKNDPIVTSYQQAVNIILDHTVNERNPHHYTRSMLAEHVAISFYEKWLQEGYTGTIEDFKNIIFRYIEYATDEDMKNGISEDKVPSVKQFHNLVTNHNEEVSDNIHSDIFHKFRLKAPVKNMPQLSLHQFIGIPRNFLNNENTETRVYENVNTGFLSTKLSVSLHGTYHSGNWIKIATNRNGLTKNYFGIDVDTTNKVVKFYYRKSATAYVQQAINISSLIEEVNNDPKNITIVMTIDNRKFTGYVQLTSTYQELPIYSTIANINENTSTVVDIDITSHDCIVTCPRMLPGDFLEDLTMYNHILDKDGIEYIFDLFN